MSSLGVFSYFIGVALAAGVAPLDPAAAQDSDDLRIRVGLGAQVRPEYVGARDKEWAPLWDLAISRTSEPFGLEAPDDNFDIGLFSSGGLSLGPVANIQSGRKDSDVGIPVGKVPTTFEAGLFAQYEVSDSIRLRSEVRKGIGGHEGMVASLGADHFWRDGDRYSFSIGPRVLLSNARYQRAWFGVDSAASAATSLSAYRPGGGVHAVAMTSGMTYQFNRDWGMFGFARYERLVGDAARSPLVEARGSKSQPSAGIGLTYLFRIKR